jgi:hypothetical protein
MKRSTSPRAPAATASWAGAPGRITGNRPLGSCRGHSLELNVNYLRETRRLAEASRNVASLSGFITLPSEEVAPPAPSLHSHQPTPSRHGHSTLRFAVPLLQWPRRSGRTRLLLAQRQKAADLQARMECQAPDLYQVAWRRDDDRQERGCAVAKPEVAGAGGLAQGRSEREKVQAAWVGGCKTKPARSIADGLRCCGETPRHSLCKVSLPATRA